MKHEWRSDEKDLYSVKTKPQLLTIRPLKYFTVKGEGNPNSAAFKDAIELLYSASYKIRMSHKKNIEPKGFFEYTVYPLEGFWSLNEKGIEVYQKEGLINKDYLTFKIMIRQPDFVDEEYAQNIIKETIADSENPYRKHLNFETIDEGLNLQILQKGTYDSEKESFLVMEAYCKEHGLERISYDHKEIYLTDTRRTKPENNKTILRIKVKK